MSETLIVGGIISGVLVFLINFIAIVVAIYKLGRAVEKFEGIGNQQSMEIRELKLSVSSLNKIVTETALQNQRLDNLSGRMGRLEQLIDDFRRGEGWILPLKGAHEVP